MPHGLACQLLLPASAVASWARRETRAPLCSALLCSTPSLSSAQSWSSLKQKLCCVRRRSSATTRRSVHARPAPGRTCAGVCMLSLIATHSAGPYSLSQLPRTEELAKGKPPMAAGPAGTCCARAHGRTGAAARTSDSVAPCEACDCETVTVSRTPALGQWPCTVVPAVMVRSRLAADRDCALARTPRNDEHVRPPLGTVLTYRIRTAAVMRIELLDLVSTCTVPYVAIRERKRNSMPIINYL